MHSVPYHTITFGWNISTGNGTKNFNKECRHPVLIWGREFYANILVKKNIKFDIILNMDWLSIFHVVKYLSSSNSLVKEM